MVPIYGFDPKILEEAMPHMQACCCPHSFIQLTTAFIYLFIFAFLGPHLWHVEVPRLGVKLELQLPAYITATAMRDSSYLSRPGIEPSSSCILVRFISTELQWEIPGQKYKGLLLLPQDHNV